MLRTATPDDLVALTDLEREANLVGLRHVFPPAQFPFPDDDVLARWALVLQDPDVEVLVRDRPAGDGSIDLLAAYDLHSLRHLAVHPDVWGRGLATWLIGVVLEEMARRGSTSADLWCLERNHRARRLYERLGWQATSDRQDAVWPPHPVELRYTRPIAARP